MRPSHLAESNSRQSEPATETQSISSNLLHKKDHSRIRYQRISEATGKEVPAEEIVRGYELDRDNFVLISDDELKEASPEKSVAVAGKCECETAASASRWRRCREFSMPSSKEA